MWGFGGGSYAVAGAGAVSGSGGRQYADYLLAQGIGVHANVKAAKLVRLGGGAASFQCRRMRRRVGLRGGCWGLRGRGRITCCRG